MVILWHMENFFFFIKKLTKIVKTMLTIPFINLMGTTLIKILFYCIIIILDNINNLQ